VITLRILAKERIAREAAAGARPLVQAAALFRELNRHPPAVVAAGHPSLLRGHTEEERLCWQVIQYATNEAAAAARLEAELHEELRRHGAVRLPDPAGLTSAAELLEQAWAAMTEAERRAWLPTPRDRRPGR
jgi:hypothetical protein